MLVIKQCPKNTELKINKTAMNAFFNNFNVEITLYYIKPLFFIEWGSDETHNKHQKHFNSIDELNGWFLGAVNALYQLPIYRVEP